MVFGPRGEYFSAFISIFSALLFRHSDPELKLFSEHFRNFLLGSEHLNLIFATFQPEQLITRTKAIATEATTQTDNLVQNEQFRELNRLSFLMNGNYCSKVISIFLRHLFLDLIGIICNYC